MHISIYNLIFCGLLFIFLVWFFGFRKRKNSILEWNMIFDPFFVNIETIHKRQILPDDLLIASYILFLARYFFICDERQIDVVQDFLKNGIKDKENVKLFGGNLYEIIFQTLDESEKNATVTLFKNLSVIGVPPIFYAESKNPKNKFAKYSFFVFEKNNKIVGSTFHMSLGGDIVLLPLSVGILYSYVSEKLRDKDKIKKLDSCIVQLLESYNFIDCRSIEALHGLPLDIISKNKLNY